METTLFVAVILCIAMATISNCQSYDAFQGEAKQILVIYSSLSDFGKNVTVTLNERALLIAGNLKLEFYDLNTSGCDDQTVPILSVLIQKQIFHASSSRVAGIVGPSCIDSAYAVAKLIQRSQAHVGHIHTSSMPIPMAAKVLNTSWGLRAPADVLANVSVELLKFANWSQFFVLYQDTLMEMSHIFFLFTRQLMEMNKSRNKTIMNAYTPTLQNIPINLGKILSDHSARILFLLLDAEVAWNVLCQAFMLRAYYPAFQWVIVKISLNDLLSVEKTSVCAKLDILRVVNNALFVNFHTHLNNQEESLEALFLYEYSIQAMSTILNNTGLLDLTSHLASDKKTQFDYASLPTFPREVCVEQIQNDTPVQIFLYSTLTSSLRRNVLENISLISSEPEECIRLENVPVAILFLSINFIILVVSMILQVITFVFRLEKSVKSSSAVLLHFCYVGIYMLNLVANIHFIKSLFIITSDKVYIALCGISIIAGSIGLTLVLGTLAMKTWRLYKIFVHYMNPGKFLSNKTLVFFVWCLTMVDLVICTSWFVFDPIQRSYLEVSRNNLEGVITYQAECASRAYIPMFMVLVGYHAVLMLIILWLMCKTQKKIPKVHNNLLSANSVMKLVYVLLFVFCSGIGGNQVALFLQLKLFNFLTLVLVIQSLQVSFLLLLLLPPVLPVLVKLLKRNGVIYKFV